MIMRPELEVYLTTYDGAQHLRLHGWLKRNNVLIKSEMISRNGDVFGTFMVFMGQRMLEKLKTANLEQGMYCDLEVMSSESSRWNLFKKESGVDWGKINKDLDDLDEKGNFPKDKDGFFNLSQLEDLNKHHNSIKKFMFSLDLQSPETIDAFVKSANETSLKLFKRGGEFVKEYIKTTAMSAKEKIQDIDIMIEYFIENGERYEDCSILQKVKEKILKYEINKLIK